MPEDERDTPSGDADDSGGPSVRQLLHWATGDREAEGKALAEDADVPEADAERAVRRAHGDLGVDEDDTTVDHDDDLATPADAEAEAED